MPASYSEIIIQEGFFSAEMREQDRGTLHEAGKLFSNGIRYQSFLAEMGG